MVSFVVLAGVVIFILAYALHEFERRYRRLRTYNEQFMQRLEVDAGACLYIHSKPELRSVVTAINEEIEMEAGR